MGKHGRQMLLAGVAIALAVCAYDRAVRLLWVGSTNLEVVFVVIDDATGEPVEGAEVVVASEGGWYAEEDRQRDAGGFALRTDAGGSARRVCRENRLVGDDSGLGFTSHRSVYPPNWVVRVSAPGHRTSEPVSLAHPDRPREVQKVAHRTHLLQVPIRLTRA